MTEVFDKTVNGKETVFISIARIKRSPGNAMEQSGENIYE
jgi:hypothetical protein